MALLAGEGKALVCGQLAVGLSAVIGLTMIPGQVSPLLLRYLNGGTLEIVGTAGTMVGTGFTSVLPSLTPNTGFQVAAAGTVLTLNVANTIYFISSGATSVVSYVQHRSQDFT